MICSKMYTKSAVSSNEKVSPCLHEVATEVKKFVCNALQEISRMQEALIEIEEKDSFEAHVQNYHQVTYEIEGIKQFLRELIIQSYTFISACKSMARYSSNDHHIQCIKDDLENGSLEKLKCFVKDLLSRLGRCCLHVDDYHTKYAELKGKVDQIMSETSTKVEKKVEHARDLHVSFNTGIASGVSAGLTGISAAVTAAAFGACPPIAFMVIAGLTLTAVGSTAAAAVGCSLAKSVNEKEHKILMRAAESVLKLQEMMHRSKTKVAMLETHLKVVSDVLQGSEVVTDITTKSPSYKFDGLKQLADIPECDKNGELESLYDIEDKLDELQDEMKNILKEIEKVKVSDKN